MRVPIEMPQLGFEVTEGRLVGWLKGIGDRVERGDLIAEVETEKATVGMEALASGTLVDIVYKGGADVSVGAVIGYLEDGR